MEKEIRTFSVQMEVRADDEGKKIEGYASIFNQEIDFMFSREVIRPGAFQRAIDEKQDVRALFNHNPDYVLGRSGPGTLTLEEDDKGLKTLIDPPDTQLARDLMTSMQRGDIDQMSFGFIVKSQKWTDRDDKPALREILDVDLFDVSVVTYPAYDQTEAGVRQARCAFDAFQAERAKAVRALQPLKLKLDLLSLDS